MEFAELQRKAWQMNQVRSVMLLLNLYQKLYITLMGVYVTKLNSSFFSEKRKAAKEAVILSE